MIFRKVIVIMHIVRAQCAHVNVNMLWLMGREQGLSEPNFVIKLFKRDAPSPLTHNERVE